MRLQHTFSTAATPKAANLSQIRRMSLCVILQTTCDTCSICRMYVMPFPGPPEKDLGHSFPNITWAIATRVSNLMCQDRALWLSPKVNIEFWIQFQPSIDIVNIYLKHVWAFFDHVWIELLVPCWEKAVADIQALSITAAAGAWMWLVIKRTSWWAMLVDTWFSHRWDSTRLTQNVAGGMATFLIWSPSNTMPATTSRQSSWPINQSTFVSLGLINTSVLDK